MIKKRVWIGLIIIIAMFPIVSASTCPPDLPPGTWICDDGGAEIFIGSGLICNYEDFRSVWEEITTGAEYPTFYTENGIFYSCEDPDNFNSGQACCGRDSICKEIPGIFPSPMPLDYRIASDRVCVASVAQFCGQLNNSDDCRNGATSFIIENSIETNPDYGPGFCSEPGRVLDVLPGWVTNASATCWTQNLCDCVWDNGDDECRARAGNQTQCTDGENQTDIFCDFTIEEIDNCDIDGSIIIKWAPAAGSHASCTSREIPIPCSSVMKLNFFTNINFIVAILGLILIYSIKLFKNKEP